MTQTLCWMGPNGHGLAGQTGVRMPGERLLPMVALTSLERALLRLLVTGYSLKEAAPSLGLSLPEAETLLAELQTRCGVSSYTRLLVLAVLKAWV